MNRLLFLLLLIYIGIHCTAINPGAPSQPASTPPLSMPTTGLPEIFMVENGVQTLAPPEVQALRDSFATYLTHGPACEGYRLTIMAPQRAYKKGEPVIIAHFIEALSDQKDLYPAGPKPVTGEYVDGHLRTAPSSQEPEAWLPATYDGRILKGPGVDGYFEATVYRFQDTGLHTILWKPGKFKSNTLSIQVK